MKHHRNGCLFLLFVSIIIILVYGVGSNLKMLDNEQNTEPISKYPAASRAEQDGIVLYLLNYTINEDANTYQITLDIVVENKAHSPLAINPGDFFVKDAQLYTYYPQYSTEPGYLAAGWLAAGEQQRGNIRVVVRPNAKDFVLYYRPDIHKDPLRISLLGR